MVFINYNPYLERFLISSCEFYTRFHRNRLISSLSMSILVYHPCICNLKVIFFFWNIVSLLIMGDPRIRFYFISRLCLQCFQQQKLYSMVKNDFFPLGKTLISCLSRPAALGDNNTRVLPRGKEVLLWPSNK